jgi:hypothetical protein
MFQNTVLRKMLGPEWEEVRARLRKLDNELHEF